jgi:hypothetical protein
MLTMDQILASNELTIALSSSIPAFILGGTSYFVHAYIFAIILLLIITIIIIINIITIILYMYRYAYHVCKTSI